jgi:hypothetical protein
MYLFGTGVEKRRKSANERVGEQPIPRYEVDLKNELEGGGNSGQRSAAQRSAAQQRIES